MEGGRAARRGGYSHDINKKRIVDARQTTASGTWVCRPASCRTAEPFHVWVLGRQGG